jgi:hypothetical protein
MSINKNKVICIKPRSHSEYDLYLISVKYELAYEILLDFKKDKSIYKFWVDMDLGIIIATETRSGKDKTIYVSENLNSEDRINLIDIKPIKTPKEKEDSKENYDKVKEIYEKLAKEKEEHRMKMLNRKYNPNNIVCVNLKISNEDIFAISQYYKLDFYTIMSYKVEDDITKAWFEKETGECFAFEYFDNKLNFSINERCLIPRNIIDEISKTPVSTPKIKKTRDNIDAYIEYTNIGYKIQIPSFDNIIKSGYTKETLSEEAGIENFSIQDLEYLLNKAVEEEDYESAAELRDVINDMKK